MYILFSVPCSFEYCSFFVSFKIEHGVVGCGGGYKWWVMVVVVVVVGYVVIVVVGDGDVVD